MPQAESDDFSYEIEVLEERVAIKQEPRSNQFHAGLDGLYRLVYPDLGITFEIDRLRRESQSLVGELAVKCKLAGAVTYNGNLSIADCNLSSARARTDRAKLLRERANTGVDVDWVGMMEEFSQRVLAADRAGQPAVDLRTVEKPSIDDTIDIDGLRLPKHHPSIIYGDGGSAKSYLALYIAGKASESGLSVGMFDWELAAEDHRDRLERMFPVMPKIMYARCERPLYYEADRLRRIAREEKLDYAILDSVAFACDGRPEDAEVAGRYFRALRMLGIGTLNLAHISKSAENNESKPFGSVFFHNGARTTWFIQLAAESAAEGTIEIALYNKKSNLGRLLPAVGFRFSFTPHRTWLSRSDPASTPELAGKLPLKQRMVSVLTHGPVAIEELAREMEVTRDAIYKAAKRFDQTFVLIKGGQVALNAKR